MDILLELAKLLLPVAAVLVSAALGFGAEFLRQKTKNEIAGRAISSVESVVKAAVLEAQQTVVESLKERNGGKLTEEEKGWIKSKVLKVVKDRLTSETLKELKGITSDLEGYLSSLIESYVYGNRLAGGKP